MTSHGFPNQFFTGFTQGGVGANNTAMYEQQATHIAYLISQTLARGAATVEPTQKAQDEWVKTIRDLAIPSGQFLEECTPGYYNNEGGGGGEGIRSAIGEPYGPGFYAFDQLIQEWRDKGDLEGLVLGT
jgi:cyclohexanone monooxygenase